jgi:heat shock protein HslJ
VRTIIRKRVLISAAAAVAVLAGLTACAGSSSTPPAAGSPSSAAASSPASPSAGSASPRTRPSGSTAAGASTVPAELQGTTFVATEVTGSYTIAPGSSITVTFEDGTVSARAGCNSMSGAVVIQGDVLVAPTLASTMMACEEALMAQDTWFAAFLASSPTWTYADGTLTLTNGTDTVAFTDAPSGAAALEETGWKLVGLISKTATANTVSALDPSLSGWIRFSDGESAFNTTCNFGGGPAEVGPDTITFGALRLTLIFCDGPSGATEQVMTTVLQGTTTYTIADQAAGGTLEIMSEDGTAGLQFVPDPTAGADAFASTSGSASSTTSSSTG